MQNEQSKTDHFFSFLIFIFTVVSLLEKSTRSRVGWVPSGMLTYMKHVKPYSRSFVNRSTSIDQQGLKGHTVEGND